MSSIEQYGEIDADAIHEMLVQPVPRRPISPGLQKRIDDEVARVREEHEIVHRLTEVHPADPDSLVVIYQSSPAATSESAPQKQVPLVAVGAETEVPGAVIPPPRLVPPDTHFSYIQWRLGWPKCETHDTPLVGRKWGKSQWNPSTDSGRSSSPPT